MVQVCSEPTSGQITRRPGGRIRAIEAKRVTIVTVDVDGSFAGSRGIVTASPGIVANKRNNDTGIASLVLGVLHVGTIGEVILQAAAGTTVFILGLEEDDRSSIGNLGLGDGCAYIFHVARRNVSEFLKLLSYQAKPTCLSPSGTPHHWYAEFHSHAATSRGNHHPMIRR